MLTKYGDRKACWGFVLVKSIGGIKKSFTIGYWEEEYMYINLVGRYRKWVPTRWLSRTEYKNYYEK